MTEFTRHFVHGVSDKKQNQKALPAKPLRMRSEGRGGAERRPPFSVLAPRLGDWSSFCALVICKYQADDSQVTLWIVKRCQSCSGCLFAFIFELADT